MSSRVYVGAHDDTNPTYTVTLTRLPADTVTDWTTATDVVLVLPDGSAQPVTKASATADQWTGTVRYDAWFTTTGNQSTVARATFSDGTVMTSVDTLTFTVKR